MGDLHLISSLPALRCLHIPGFWTRSEEEAAKMAVDMARRLVPGLETVEVACLSEREDMNVEAFFKACDELQLG